MGEKGRNKPRGGGKKNSVVIAQKTERAGESKSHVVIKMGPREDLETWRFGNLVPVECGRENVSGREIEGGKKKKGKREKGTGKEAKKRKIKRKSRKESQRPTDLDDATEHAKGRNQASKRRDGRGRE